MTPSSSASFCFLKQEAISMNKVILSSKLRKQASGTHQSRWPEPLGADALHGLPGKFLAAIDPHNESNPLAILMQVLIAFGSLIGAFRRAAIESLSQSLEGRVQC